MSSLKAFLNPIKVENKEVIVSERFVEDSKPVPFVIRPVTQEENEEILRRFRKTVKKGKDVQETFDQIGYSHELAATAVVFPDLKKPPDVAKRVARIFAFTKALLSFVVSLSCTIAVTNFMICPPEFG